MRERLRFLSMAEVEEGMVLGKPLVVAKQGVIDFTLPTGHALTETNLRQMTVRQVEFVCICAEDTRTDAEREAELANETERLARVFVQADLREPTLAGLHAAVLAYRSL
jgi:hypothetical protein